MKNLLSLTFLMFVLTMQAQTFDEYNKAADAAFSEGNMALALENYSKAVELITEAEGHSRTYAYAGICAKEMGQTEQAKAYMLASVERGIEEPMIFNMLGEIAKKEKDYDTQILAYKAGVERSPVDHIKYQLKLCPVYKKKKDYDSMLACATDVLSLDPTNTKGLSYKGSALQGKKDMTGAAAAYTELYAVDSSNINANLFLGNYNYQVGKNKLASARKKYDKIAKPTRVQWSEHNKYNTSILNSYYADAIPYLKYVYDTNGNENIKTILSNIHTKMGNPEEAKKYQ